MSIEEWKDESNIIPPGEITLPSKEEIEKRTEAMPEGQAAAIAIMQDLQEKRRAFKERLDKEEITIQPGEFIVKPVFYHRSMEFFIRVTPIKRKLNRYSKKYIKKIAIKVTDLGKVPVINKEQ